MVHCAEIKFNCAFHSFQPPQFANIDLLSLLFSMSMFLFLKVNFWHIYVTHLTLFPADPSVLSDNSTCDTSCQDSHLLTQSVPHNETPLSQKSDLNPYFKREKGNANSACISLQWVGNIWCYQLGVWIFWMAILLTWRHYWQELGQSQKHNPEA